MNTRRIHNPQGVTPAALPPGYRFAYVGEKLTPNYRWWGFVGGWYAGGAVGRILGKDGFSEYCTCCVIVEPEPEVQDVEVL